MAKIYLYNPPDGAPIKNAYDGSERWSLDVGEAKAFPEKAGNYLKNTFEFLQEQAPDDAVAEVKRLEAQVVSEVKAKEDGTGLEPKSPEEKAKDEEKLEEKKEVAKKKAEKIKAAPEAEPENPSYHELKRGELITLCAEREIELKGYGKRNIKKEELIQLLENDDKNK
jgi:hypothetical protein